MRVLKGFCSTSFLALLVAAMNLLFCVRPAYVVALRSCEAPPFGGIFFGEASGAAGAAVLPGAVVVVV